MKMNTSIAIPIILALCAGAVLPLQGAINSRLSMLLNNTLLTSTISFAVGFCVLLVLFLIFERGTFDLQAFKQTTPMHYLGGILGAFLVTTLIIAVPKIGVANTLIMIIIGQMCLSVAMDHYALLGVATRTLDTTRILGMSFVVMGAVLVYK